MKKLIITFALILVPVICYANEPGFLGLRWGMTINEASETIKKYYPIATINKQNGNLIVTGISNKKLKISLAFKVYPNKLYCIQVEEKGVSRYRSEFHNVLEPIERNENFRLIRNDIDTSDGTFNQDKKLLSKNTEVQCFFHERKGSTADWSIFFLDKNTKLTDSYFYPTDLKIPSLP